MFKTIFSLAMLSLLCSMALTMNARTTKAVDQDITISGHDLKRTVTCRGNNVVIDANDSVLTLKGECNEVQVNGSTNTITIDTVASILLNSADNTVRWRKATQGEKPKLVDKSTGNKVEQLK
jgi:hypothetical protein